VLEKMLTVVVIARDVFAMIATIWDVVTRPLVLNSQWRCHAGKANHERRLNVNT
jgi:hypothetical protein